MFLSFFQVMQAEANAAAAELGHEAAENVAKGIGFNVEKVLF